MISENTPKYFLLLRNFQWHQHFASHLAKFWLLLSVFKMSLSSNKTCSRQYGNIILKRCTDKYWTYRLSTCTAPLALHKKCPYSELFWSVFSRNWAEYREILRISEYGELLRISTYSVQMRKNTAKITPNTETFCAVNFSATFFSWSTFTMR